MLNFEFIRQVGAVRWFSRYATIQFRKRVLRRDTTMRLPTGSHLILPRHSPSATEVYVTGASIDWGSEQLFAEHADRDRDFLDVGAHIGYYSAYLAPRVRRVFAFEPDPRNLAALRANAALAGNVTVVPSAVSSRDGRASLFTGRGSAENTLEARGDGPSIEVAVTTIDAFVERDPEIRVGLLKTDAEGHDLEALLGASRTIARDAPLVLTECGWSDQLEALVRTWRYQTFAFARDPRTRRDTLARLDGHRTRYKMLFLVPPRLAASFAARVEASR